MASNIIIAIFNNVIAYCIFSSYHAALIPLQNYRAWRLFVTANQHNHASSWTLSVKLSHCPDRINITQQNYIISFQDCTIYDISVTLLIHKTFLSSHATSNISWHWQRYDTILYPAFWVHQKQTPLWNIFLQGLQSMYQSTGSCTN